MQRIPRHFLGFFVIGLLSGGRRNKVSDGLSSRKGEALDALVLQRAMAMLWLWFFCFSVWTAARALKESAILNVFEGLYTNGISQALGSFV